MGEAPDGTSIYLGTLRVEINQKCIYSWSRSTSEKSFKIFSKSYRISWACTYGTLELGSLYEREINQKLGSKINRAAR